MGNAYRSVLALKPTGDAVPANVLSGKTFSNADGTGKTGTMANNGAVSITLTDLNPTYTIPEGYHNGLGVVGFTSSGGGGVDLVVTCNSAFANKTITCTDGTTTFEEICPNTSPYQVVFESIPTGTWTISVIYSGHTYSTILTVVNFETTLNPIPEGSTATPTDDIQTWLNCADIWDKTYTSLSEVLADPSTLQTVIASNNAADYMARSTTWANDVVADSSAMTYIGLNNYCANKLLADATWLNAICNSTYFESVLNVHVPTMTSNTTPSGEVFCSSILTSGWPAWHAFNKNLTDAWASDNAEGSTGGYVGYKFTSPIEVHKITLNNGISSERNLDIKDFIIQGSNDNDNWVDIYSGTATQSAPSITQNFAISNSTKYLYIRIYCQNNYNPSRGLGISEVDFYGRV